MRRYNTFFYGVTLIVISMVLHSCTLVLEDIEIPDDKHYAEDLETVGFDEPYTQETEYGNVTFQYNDHTRVLKKAALDYLVEVDGDSVLYFTDNIPSELLMRPGDYVSMGCSRALPIGLCSKVLSVEKMNGMIKMVTSRAPQEEVFKVLDIDLDFTYIPQHPIDMYVLDTGDSVVYDFDLLDGVYPAKQVREYSQRRARARNLGIDIYEMGHSGTRAGTEVDHDEEDKRTNQEDMTIFKFTNDGIGFEYGLVNGLPTLFRKLEQMHVQWDFSIIKSIDMDISSKTVLSEDKDKTLREEKVVDRSNYKISLALGMHKDNLDMNGVKEQVSEWKNMMNQLIYKGPFNATNEKFKAALFRLPIPGMPAITCFLRADPGMSFDCSGFGKATVEVKTPVTTTYAKYEGKKEISKFSATSGSYSAGFKSVSFAGTISVGLFVEALVGVGDAAGLSGLGLGGKLSTTATLNVESEIYNSSEPSKINPFTNDNTNVSLDVTLQFRGAAFFGDKVVGFDIGKPIPIWNKTEHLYPSLNGKNNSAIMKKTVNSYGEGMEMIGKFSFATKGLAAYLGGFGIKPRMLYSYKENGNTHNIVMNADGYSGLSADYTYTFKYVDNDYKNHTDYCLKPAFEFMGSTYSYNGAEIIPFEENEPAIYIYGTYYTEKFGSEFPIFDEEKGEETTISEVDAVKVTQCLKLVYGENISKKYQYWGVNIKVRYNTEKFGSFKDMKLKQNRFKFGNDLFISGNYNLSFTIPFPKEAHQLQIEIEPFFVDKENKTINYVHWSQSTTNYDFTQTFITINRESTPTPDKVVKGKNVEFDREDW